MAVTRRQSVGASRSQEDGSEGRRSETLQGNIDTTLIPTNCVSSSSDGGRLTVARLLREMESALLGSLAASDRADARAEALVLAGHALRLESSDLLASVGSTVIGRDAEAARGLLRRRIAGEPTTYIVGLRWFYGLDFAVDPRVLVPRPETELLVERALDAVRDIPEPLVCDIGCGSGCVGIAIAVHNPAVRVLAVDISADCLAVARANAIRHNVGNRIELLQGDLLGPVSSKVHAIVANLPYVPSGQIADLDAVVRDHEPRLALDGGPDGLRLISRLLENCAVRLLPHGHVIVEVGWDQSAAVGELANRMLPGWKVSIHQDLAGISRVVEVTAA